MKRTSILAVRNLSVDIVEGATIKCINWPMIVASEIVFLVCMKQGEHAVLTGASQNEAYPKGGIHDRGMAWDFRSEHLPRPKSAFLELHRALTRLDSSFRVLYHDVGFGLHFHIEYRCDSGNNQTEG